MEPHKPGKLKLKLKFSKPLDNNHMSPQQKTVLNITQESQQEQQQQPFVQRKQEDLDVVVHDQLEEDGIPKVEQQQQQVKDERKVCSYCRRVFKHGKALGGHLRIHDEHNPKTKGYGSSPSSDTGGGEDQNLCEICYKKFPSKMSLYGHMRSHSNRGYRGINPPPPMQRYLDENSDNQSPSQLDYAVVDGLKGLMGWKSKGRRGQLGYSSVEPLEVPSPLLSYCHHPKEATGELMMSDGGEFTSQVKDDVRRKGKRIEKYDDDELYYLQDYLGLSYPNTSTNNKNAVCSYLGAFSDTPLKNSEKSLPSKKRMTIRDMEYAEVVAKRYDDDDNHRTRNNDLDVEDEKTWLCTTWGKSFDTHQGLGGHKSSHTRERVIQFKKHNPNPTQAQAQTQIENRFGLTYLGFGIESGATGMRSDEEMVREFVHKCKICNQDFPSGLALAGHESCHYVVPSMDSFPGQTSSQTGCQGTTSALDPNVTIQEDGDNDSDIDIKSI